MEYNWLHDVLRTTEETEEDERSGEAGTSNASVTLQSANDTSHVSVSSTCYTGEPSTPPVGCTTEPLKDLSHLTVGPPTSCVQQECDERAASPHDYIASLLKLLPTDEADAGQSALKQHNAQQSAAASLPPLESMVPQPAAAWGYFDPCPQMPYDAAATLDVDTFTARLCEMYGALYGSWIQSVHVLMERFSAEIPPNEQLVIQLRKLSAEHQQLKNENLALRAGQAWHHAGTPTLSSQGLTPISLQSPVYCDGLLAQHDLAGFDDVYAQMGALGAGGDGEKAFESQIDRAKMKTKLCKYFMQSDQGFCPFYRRHGWCAFAHGEKELSSYLASGSMQGSPVLPPTPQLIPSPVHASQGDAYTALSPSFRSQQDQEEAAIPSF
eukprot:Rhum_TRINITY_DN3368_c0_g1::Rhum_TRINITY_DN3368_c0_g1_i1::g.10471::m.10471